MLNDIDSKMGGWIDVLKLDSLEESFAYIFSRNKVAHLHTSP